MTWRERQLELHRIYSRIAQLCGEASDLFEELVELPPQSAINDDEAEEADRFRRACDFYQAIADENIAEATEPDAEIQMPPADPYHPAPLPRDLARRRS